MYTIYASHYWVVQDNYQSLHLIDCQIVTYQQWPDMPDFNSSLFLPHSKELPAAPSTCTRQLLTVNVSHASISAQTANRHKDLPLHIMTTALPSDYELNADSNQLICVTFSDAAS